MSNTLFGAGCFALQFFFQPASPNSSGFTPIKRLPLTPSFSPNCFINPSSNRLMPRCKDRSRDARISDEEEQEDWVSSPSASPYQILGIDHASCSPARLKSAFRARVHAKTPSISKP